MQRITRKHIAGALVIILLLLLVVNHVHQKTHFNKNVSIDNVSVGRLTAQQAYDKLSRSHRTSKIYVNGDLVYQGKREKSGFKANDKANFQKALNKQYTAFPTSKRINLLIEPTNLDKTALNTIDSKVSAKVNQLNQNRRAPHDAYAVYKNNSVQVVPAVQGTQYDDTGIYQTLNKEYVNGTIHLNLKQKVPLSANSRTVKNEKNQLNKLRNRQVTYQVQNKQYRLSTTDIISQATYKNGKYHFDTSNAKEKLQSINNKQATLNKKFRFKTPDGHEIETSSAGTYGWKISINRAGKSLANALASDTKQINAKHDIYGKGYNRFGTGYSVTSNHGIGNTYAAVSIAKQHAWFYKNGKCVLSTDIVSGSNNADNKTPKGVWYIMYQQSPSVLRGNNDDGSKYASKVQYWSPFTLSGCGFHDASWRTDWSKNEYKQTNGGSHGCINMHPSNAGAGYKALSINEPVVIY